MKKVMKYLGFTTLVIILITGCLFYFLIAKERLKAPRWQLESDNITVNHIDRSFSYFVPEDCSRNPALIFILHGSNGSISLMRYITNYEFEKQATKRKNYIVVYPEAYENHWNDCRKSANYSANTRNIDDNEFFKSLIKFFAKKYNIDTQKVYASGISNGGQMCLKLAYEMPDVFKGVGIFSANNPIDQNNDCIQSKKPISIIIFNGTEDKINPYDGGWVVTEQDSSRGVVHSSMETFNYWKNLLPDTCLQKSVLEKYYFEDELQSVKSTFINCHHSNHKVNLVTVNYGGHTIPLTNKPPYIPKFIGRTNSNINAPEIMLNFFESLEYNEESL